MYNCIYSGHCFDQQQCDRSCPVLAQTTYLLERNGIQMNNPVFRLGQEGLQKYSKILEESSGQMKTVIESSSTNFVADCLAYCGICTQWKGSQLHCTVFNLKFAQYIDAIQKSWSYNSSDSESEYLKIWASNAKVLIISNIDFVNFKDFQCQTLLSLLQSRMNPDLTTIVVSPPISNLVGDGPFFNRLCDMLSRTKVG